MAHTITLLTRVRVRRVSLDQSKDRVDGDVVIYLLRFFLTMPSRDTPASSRTEASMAALESGHDSRYSCLDIQTQTDRASPPSSQASRRRVPRELGANTGRARQQ